MLALKKYFLRRSCAVYCTYLNLVGICFHFLLKGVAYFTQRWTGSTRVLLTSIPSAHVVAFICLKFFIWFRKVFLKLNQTSSFTVKGLIPDEELAKAIA